MKRIRVRRLFNLNGVELGLATILGVLGGIYIWKPVLDKAYSSQKEETLETQSQEGSNNKGS